MQNRKLLLTTTLLVAFGLVAALVSMAYGSHPANAGIYSFTSTATPCPYDEVPDPDGPGCHKVTITMTPTAIPCPTDMVYDPYIHACVPITPTRTPCPTNKVPSLEHSGCGTPTFTPTSQHPYPCSALMPGSPAAASTRGGLSQTQMPIRTPCIVTVTPTPCPTDTGPDPVHGGCIPITPTPILTPCPTEKVFDSYHGSGCGTPTPTPTSNRPYGAEVTLVDHYPRPAVSGQKETWVLQLENIGSQYGCEPHEVTLNAHLTGQADAGFYQSVSLGCHETAQITVSSIVTVPLGASAGITATASAGAAMGNTVDVSEDVVNPPPPTVPPTPPRQIGDVNCDGYTNSIDAALILQYHARLIGSLQCADSADVNNDEAINSIDALLLLQYIVVPCAPSVPC